MCPFQVALLTHRLHKANYCAVFIPSDDWARQQADTALMHPLTAPTIVLPA